MYPDAKYIAANLTGIPFLFNLFYRKRPLVIAYHGIYDGPRRPHALPPTFIHVKDLKAQLEAIKRRYRVLSPDRFAHHVETGKPFLPDSALITFDDGYESFGSLAAPVLEHLGLHAIVFVATHYLETMKPFWFDIAWLYLKTLAAGHYELLVKCAPPLPFAQGETTIMRTLKAMEQEKRDYLVAGMLSALEKCSSPAISGLRLFCPLSPQKLKYLTDNGFWAGGHTHSHTILSNLPDQQAKVEIGRNKLLIEDITGRRCRLFAYPNGGFSDYLPIHKEMLWKDGYVAAFSLTQKRSHPFLDTMDISRINVAPEDSIRSLLYRASGIVPIINYFRKSFRSNRFKRSALSR